MKAYNLHGISDLRLEEIQEPELKDGWVLVEMKAAGVCGSDIPRIYETGTYHFPTIPGHEFSGIVKKVYTKEDSMLIGKRVGIFPLIPCKECINCKNEDYEMCQNYSYLGSRTDGGFAEYVKVPTWNLIEIPKEVTYEAAAMLEPMSVALHALRQLPVKEIHSITIFGLGPIGLVMAQWARFFGIEDILLIGNKEQQIRLAEKAGFHKNCNLKTTLLQEWVKEQTNGFGTDAVVDCVGSNAVLSDCLEIVKSKGYILIVGNPKDDLHIQKGIYWKLHRKQLRVYGTWNSSYKCTDEQKDDWKCSMNALQKKAIDVESLITHRISFENLKESLPAMRDKKNFYCKVMVVR